MKKIFTKAGTIIALSAIVLVSCNKFDDINTNPNATEKVNSALLATKVILQNLQFQGRDAKAYLSDNGLSKYIAYGNETMLASQYNYLGETSFSPMTMLPNINSMLTYAKGSTMESSYQGLAKFSRAYMFYYLTMEVGDIPYSASGDGSTGGIKPKYDLQVDVFKGILDELKEAATLFGNGVKFDGDPTPYNGDPDKWMRATNSFALRVLMSLSNKAGDATLNVKGRFAEIVNSGKLLEPGTGFLGLAYTSTNPHPMSGTNDLFTSRTIVSHLVLSSLKNLNDKRLFYFADPAKSKIAGGLTQSDTAAYTGANVGDDYNTITTNLIADKYSLLNSRYLKVQAGDPRIMVSYGEQQLILAEARILGWITAGDAEAYYKSGVSAALARFKTADPAYAHGNPITQSYIDNYFTGEAAFKATTGEQLKQIWMQRYLLNFMQDPVSAFFLQRRTGYPPFPINPATSLNVNDKNAIPVRWLYPSSELNYNKANLIEALDRQYGGVDEINNDMWLLK